MGSARDSKAVIVVPQAPVIRHKSDFFRDGFLSMMLIGKSGCGKTQFLANILPGISDNINTIIIASKVHRVPAHEAIVKYFKSRGKLSGITNTPDELREFTDIASRHGLVNMKKQGLLIFDDFNDGKATGPYWSAVIDSFTKLRNDGWNFVILCQYPTFVPPIVRSCTTCRVLFCSASKSAYQGFVKDISADIADMEAYNVGMAYIREVPYSYIYVQHSPFEVSVGKGNSKRKLLTRRDVIVPTLKELLRELDVKDEASMDTKTKRLQKEIGNDAPELVDVSLAKGSEHCRYGSDSEDYTSDDS